MGANGKLRTVPNGYAAYCPGCQEYHVIYNTWQFNGNYVLPSFTPSLLVKGYSEKLERDYVCHSFITNGEWHFLGDCSHELAGQTVAMKDES